jgi:hypothetical protein
MSEVSTMRNVAGTGAGLTYSRAVQAGIAGVAGTVVFDLFGLVAMGEWWDVPAMLGGAIGGGLAVGVLAHYANGVLLGIIFVGLMPLFFGPTWARALQFITVQTVFGVWLFMMPLAGMGALGLGMGAMFPVMILVRHWFYAAVLGLVYDRLTRSA